MPNTTRRSIALDGQKSYGALEIFNYSDPPSVNRELGSRQPRATVECS